jgi:hypothetical protein
MVITTHVGQASREPREHTLVDLLTAALNGFTGAVAKILDRPITDRHANDWTGEQPPLLEPVERAERHYLCKVARDPEHDEYIRRRGLAVSSVRRAHRRARFDRRRHVNPFPFALSLQA